MTDDYSMPPERLTGGEPPSEQTPGANGANPVAALPAQPEPPSDAPVVEAFREQVSKLSPSLETDLSLPMQVEGLLFVAPGSVPVAQLSAALDVSVAEIEKALAHLDQDYRTRGIRLQRSKDRVQLTSAPSMADRVERFLGLENTAHLTRASLETLAIIAYQQPLTRPRLDSIRGVNSDSVLKNLLAKGLIEEVGRTDGPGRPVLYGTTPEFLQHFGLGSLSDLPPLHLAPSVPTPVTGEPGNGKLLKE